MKRLELTKTILFPTVGIEQNGMKTELLKQTSYGISV